MCKFINIKKILYIDNSLLMLCKNYILFAQNQRFRSTWRVEKVRESLRVWESMRKYQKVWESLRKFEKVWENFWGVKGSRALLAAFKNYDLLRR